MTSSQRWRTKGKPRVKLDRPRRALRSLVQLASLLGVIFGFAYFPALAQVGPQEILNPQRQAAEKASLPQLLALNRAITAAKFEFPFAIRRYIGVDPKSPAAADTRGIEFVKFNGRAVLKISGNYNAAFSARKLTQNQRAARVFSDVIVPILKLLPKEIPASVTCDAVGFEIAYHVQSSGRNFEYEGKEILAVVLGKADAFGYFKSSRDAEKQDLLNRSEVYVNGKAFGLALGGAEPLPVEALERSDVHRNVAPGQPATEDAAASEVRLSRIYEDLPPDMRKPPAQSEAERRLTASPAQAAPPTVKTSLDAERLQTKYQTQLDALMKGEGEKLHLAEYAPPSFVVYRSQVYLQLTLRNAQRSDTEGSSIYKRAAQTFDLFLAPQLKTILQELPAGDDYDGVDITVLNQLSSKGAPSSEAIEFVCPLAPLRQFTDAQITNQELIDKSLVLINGVRVALNLQQVE